MPNDPPMRTFHPAVYLAVLPTILVCFLVATNVYSASSFFQQMFLELEVAIPSRPAFIMALSTNAALVILVPVLSAVALVICTHRFSATVTLSATLGTLALAILCLALVFSVFSIDLLAVIKSL